MGNGEREHSSVFPIRQDDFSGRSIYREKNGKWPRTTTNSGHFCRLESISAIGFLLHKFLLRNKFQLSLALDFGVRDDELQQRTSRSNAVNNQVGKSVFEKTGIKATYSAMFSFCHIANSQRCEKTTFRVIPLTSITTTKKRKTFNKKRL